MNILIILVGFSMLVAGGFLVAFLWAVRSGQFKDTHTPTLRMLYDDDDRPGTRRSRTHSS
jgi:cbb3-type cytochrome oxidase maturation protein